VVDEASMMRLPELILSGSFLSKNSQILVAGDHRQLPPIVAHDWDKEDRRTLEEMASFLSVDFLRFCGKKTWVSNGLVANIPRIFPLNAYAKATGATQSWLSFCGNGCMRRTGLIFVLTRDKC
jgi:hypothetical protein